MYAGILVIYFGRALGDEYLGVVAFASVNASDGSVGASTTQNRRNAMAQSFHSHIKGILSSSSAYVSTFN